MDKKGVDLKGKDAGRKIKDMDFNALIKECPNYLIVAVGDTKDEEGRTKVVSVVNGKAGDIGAALQQTMEKDEQLNNLLHDVVLADSLAKMTGSIMDLLSSARKPAPRKSSKRK